jgi:anti-anti-sigma regulatory factor
VTTPKSPRNRKPSARVQPRRAIVTAAKTAPAAAPTAAPAAAPAVEASAAFCVLLEPGLEIKDAESVYGLLLAALGDGRAVTVDVSRVRAVDTAGAQLLLAFQGEASRCGVTIEFRGESVPLAHTLAVLGLSDKFAFGALRG